MKDITYCTSTDCPSSECRIKLLNNKIPAGEIISMADFSKECRRQECLFYRAADTLYVQQRQIEVMTKAMEGRT